VKYRLLILTAVLLMPGGAGVFAHEARPGYLELREMGPDTYDFLWKRPSGGEVELHIPFNKSGAWH
jgi:hypothetical protein